MTQEEAKKWLPLISAKAEGKAIQFYCTHDGWVDEPLKRPWVLDSHPEHYRIKPEPKLVPWTKSNAPEVAIYNFPNRYNLRMGILNKSHGKIDFGDKNYTFELLINYGVTWSRSLDGPWLSCGTYEEEA